MDFDSLKQSVKDVGKRIVKSLLKTSIGRKVIIVGCIAAIIIFVGALKIIKHIDTAGDGNEMAKVPGSVSSILDEVGVSTSVKSTSSGSSSDSYSTPNSNNVDEQISKKLVKAAQECHKYLRENNYIYRQVGLEIPDGIYGQNTIDCSSYVSWVYYTAGYNTFKAGQENAFVDNYEKHNLKQVSQKDAQPGDIIVYSGHVEILAEIKNGQITKAYNCGSNNSIQSLGLDGLQESSNPSIGYNGQPKMILRPKELSTSENPIKGSSVSSITIAENKIFFIGDSWMEGLKGTNIAKSPSAYFYSKVGTNADWVLETYDEMKKKLSNDASSIVVAFGLNGRTNWGKTQELIEKLLNDFSNKPIYVLQTPHICDGYTVDPDFNNGVDKYNENMKNYCSGKNGVTFIDPTINIVSENGKGYLKQEYAQNFNDTSMGGGKIHLNRSGYNVWYKDIVSLIQGLASSDGTSSGGQTGVASSTNISGHIIENGRKGYKVDIDLDKKVDEIIKKFEEENIKDLEKYLTDKNRKEYLKTFIHAAMATSYPDLRNISEFGKQVPGGEVQGIIKLKRKTKDTNENDEGYYLQYIPFDQYNNLKEKKDNSIFNYFTVNKSGEFVVAGYEKTTAEPQKVDTADDPRPDEVEDNSEESKYVITDSSINYAQQVEKYAMPFDLLWTLLVYSGDENFVNDLAKLVIDSEIIITVCDNITYTDKEDVYTYIKNEKTKENTTFKDITQNPPKTSSENRIKKYSAELPDKKYKYTITNITHYEVDIPSIAVTYADTWAMKYKAEVKKDTSSSTDSNSTKGEDDKKYTDNGQESVNASKISNLNSWKKDYEKILHEAYQQDIDNTKEAIKKQNEEIEIAKKLKEEREKEKAKKDQQTVQSQQTNQTQQKEESTQDTNNQLSDAQIQAIINQKPIEEFKMKYEYYDMKLEYKEKLTNKNRNITTKKTEYKYITEPGKTTGKDDLNSDEEGFVKLLKKYKGAEKSLKELILWFFDSVEAQESICDMEDLLKYLLQKEMNIDLGVEEFDFDEYGTRMMHSGGNGNVVFEGGTVEEIVWNAFVSAGFSEYTTSGVMASIWGESRFDPAVIEAENGIGYGLCQWSYERRTNYEAYAASKGREASDLNTQIEFLLGDLGVEQYISEYNKDMKYWRCSASTRGYSFETPMYGIEDLKNAKSPEEAGKIFEIWYEGPLYYDSGRETWAREYYEKYKGKRPTVQNNNSENYTGNTTSSTNGRYTTVNFGGRTYNIYDQTDPTGEFGLSNPSGACSITSEAIVLSGYINCTPADTQSHYPNYPRNVSDIGNDLTRMGVSCKSYYLVAGSSRSDQSARNEAIKNIANNLNKGKPVIVLVTNSDSSEVANPGKYVRYGAHYMALLGFNSQGNVVIGDPWGGRVREDISLNDLVNYYMYEGSNTGSQRGYALIN